MNTKSVSLLLISADPTLGPLIRSSLQPPFPALHLHLATDYSQALDYVGRTDVDLVLIGQMSSLWPRSVCCARPIHSYRW